MIALLGISCLAALYCTMQNTALGKITDNQIVVEFLKILFQCLRILYTYMMCFDKKLASISSPIVPPHTMFPSKFHVVLKNKSLLNLFSGSCVFTDGKSSTVVVPVCAWMSDHQGSGSCVFTDVRLPVEWFQCVLGCQIIYWSGSCVCMDVRSSTKEGKNSQTGLLRKHYSFSIVIFSWQFDTD